MKMGFYAPAGVRVFLLISWLLAATCACSFGAGQTTTDRSSSAATALKPGHWVNEVGTNGYQDVSFDLAVDGTIENFNMRAYISPDPDGCQITVDHLPMQVNEDGTFVISHFIDYDTLAKQMGPAVMSIIAVPTGQPYEALHISGNTTDTSMDGTFELRVCGGSMYFSQNTGPWKAHWKSP